MRNNYINHFFSLNCAHDLMPFFVGNKKNAAKEITESFGCYHACDDMDVNNSVVIVPGDGVRPRTAAVFSFMTKAEVHSIDPDMRMEWFEKTLYENFKLVPKRLTVYPKKAEEVKIDCKGKNCIIVACHSHATMDEMLDVPYNYSGLQMVNVPCCVNIPERYTLKNQDLKFYNDPGIWSPRRAVYVWKQIRRI